MPRKSNRHSRLPAITDREFALREELKRIRAELAALRKQAQAKRSEPCSGLSSEERLSLVKKIGRMFRHGVLHHITEADRCPVCGGMTEAQIQTGWEDWVRQEEGCVARADAWRTKQTGGLDHHLSAP